MNTLLRRLTVFCWLWLTSLLLRAQDSTHHQLRVFAELGTVVSSSPDRVPFWLAANQYGIIPSRPQAGLVQVGVRYNSRLGTSKKWGVEAAVEGVGQTNNPTVRLILPEAFARIFYKKWELVAGRRREIVGMQDSTLSSGGVLWSGNTLPIPQIRIGTSGYVSLPILKHWLKVKGLYSHGWFENSRPFVQNAFLHYKSVYLQVGKDTWPVSVYAGLAHMVQWGGYAPALKDDPGVFSEFGHFGSSLQDYLDVVTARSGQDKLSGLGPGQLSSFDLNRVGNHVATLDVGTTITLPKSRLVLYRQHFIEDGSLFYLLNILDGLNGLRWYRTDQPQSNFSINRLTAELMYSVSQGGVVFDIDDPRKRGRDNYYNHGQYRDGWSYFGRTLGTPFIPPDTDMNAKYRRNLIYTSNNRVVVFHLGVAGTLFRRVGWETKLSYSRNQGTYDFPLSPAVVPQFSGLVRARTALPYLGGLEVNSSVAWDYGGIYDDAVGVYLGVRKSWNSVPDRRATPTNTSSPKRRFGF